MPETVTHNQELNLIEVMSFGHVTGEEIDKSIHSIIDIMNATGCDKVLINALEQTSMPGAHTLSKLASKLPSRIQFAILIAKNQPTYEDHKFFKTASFNRGITLKMFESKQEVNAWLQA